MEKLASFLREIWPDLWKAIVALFGYHKGRGDAERDRELEQAKFDAEAYRRVLGALRADGLSDNEVLSEVRRRGLLRLPKE